MWASEDEKEVTPMLNRMDWLLIMAAFFVVLEQVL